MIAAGVTDMGVVAVQTDWEAPAIVLLGFCATLTAIVLITLLQLLFKMLYLNSYDRCNKSVMAVGAKIGSSVVDLAGQLICFCINVVLKGEWGSI